MRLIHLTKPGHLEVNFMWLPTWLGINRAVKDVLEQDLNSKVVGIPATEENLDAINEMVLESLLQKYPITGLRDYLEGLKFVQL